MVHDATDADGLLLLCIGGRQIHILSWQWEGDKKKQLLYQDSPLASLSKRLRQLLEATFPAGFLHLHTRHPSGFQDLRIHG